MGCSECSTPGGLGRHGVDGPDPLLGAIRHGGLQGCVPLAGQGMGQLLAVLLKGTHNLQSKGTVSQPCKSLVITILAGKDDC